MVMQNETEKPSDSKIALEAIDISRWQDEDSDVKELKDFLSRGIPPSEERSRDRIRNFSSQYILEEDVLYHLWSPKVKGVSTRLRKQLVVPKKEIGKLLVYGHDKLGHPGFMRTISWLRNNYFWASMKKDVARHCKTVKLCGKEISKETEDGTTISNKSPGTVRNSRYRFRRAVTSDYEGQQIRSDDAE
eukprot:gene17858-19638_t